VTTRNSEAAAAGDGDSDVGDSSDVGDGSDDDEDTPPTWDEHVRNYVAFVCLKALMCPTLIQHPDRGENVLGPKLLRPWAMLVHHLRDQLIIERLLRLLQGEPGEGARVGVSHSTGLIILATSERRRGQKTTTPTTPSVGVCTSGWGSRSAARAPTGGGCAADVNTAAAA
jgi:hypothetical protein